MAPRPHAYSNPPSDAQRVADQRQRAIERKIRQAAKPKPEPSRPEVISRADYKRLSARGWTRL